MKYLIYLSCLIIGTSSFRIEDLWGNNNNDATMETATGEKENITFSTRPLTTTTQISRPTTINPSTSASVSPPLTTISLPSPNVCAGHSTGYIPHKTNCSLFYSCQNNNAIDGSCPQSMWFDPNHNGVALCNFPEVVCAADNTVCNCAIEYPPPPPDTLIEPWVTCLKDNQFHFMASKIDCGRYFVCYNEHVSRMECRDGFQFNEKTKQCDYSHNVNCKMPDPDCPVDGVRFLPHPDRCDGFMFCIYGYKTPQACPFYHYWDDKSISCKLQDEVRCKNGKRW